MHVATAKPLEQCKYVPRTGERLGAYTDAFSPRLVPIYVLFKDKTAALRELLRSAHEVIGTSFEVVVIDFDSTIQSALDLLVWLEGHGVTVWRTRLSGSNNANILNSAGDIISKDLAHRSAAVDKYVVTDTDISLAGATGDVLDVYAKLLDAFSDANVVGPSLRLDDLPDTRATYTERRDSHLKLFFPDSLASWMDVEGHRKIYFSWAPIDTTFGMFRRSYKFHRLTRGLRVHFPYAMRRVDFYDHTGEAMPPEMRIWGCRANKKTHFHIDNCTEVPPD